MTSEVRFLVFIKKTLGSWLRKRKQSHSFSNWYNITQNTAFPEYFTSLGLSIVQPVAVLVHCQAWWWLKNPYPTQFPSSHSYGIFVFHSRPWCQQLMEFSPSSSRVKDLTWMRQEKTELYFLSTPAASAERALKGQKNISGTPNFEFLKEFGPPVLSY